ncbi:MAG TPA: hypothetical protein DGG94_14705, partial [Micromonosporaceae bacterium]|nr:hypothetical protein [Micromonosporaceae bacterium]
MRIRLVTLVLAVALGGFGVAVQAQPASAQGPLDADFIVRASAVCDVELGQWMLRWGISTPTATATLLSARDPVNNLDLALPSTAVSPDHTANATGALAGTAVVTAFEATLQVPGESSPRIFRRDLPLGQTCAASDIPACVDLAAARYQHTFDPTAGRVTVRTDGPPPCTTRNALLTITYEPVGWPVTIGLAYGYLSPKHSLAVVQIDRLPCSNKLELAIGGTVAGSPGSPSTGPYASHRAELGVCTSPGIQERHTCTGLELDITNHQDAGMSALTTVLGPDLPDGTRQVWFLQLAPGQSQRVFVQATGEPLAATAQFTINRYP